jgi:hypothetical protein
VSSESKRCPAPLSVSPSVDYFFLFPAPIWFVFLAWHEIPRDAYIECWSRGDVCIVENACGADGPLGNNPVELEPDGVV